MTASRIACLLSLGTVLAAAQTADSGAWLALDREVLDFRHENGAFGEKYLVETMGSGVVLFDMEGDGDADIYLLNGAPLEERVSTAGTPTNALYRNNGDRTFTEVTAVSGTGDAGYGTGGCAGDVDNDGDTDLYVGNFGPDVLYLNRGDGTFLAEPMPVEEDRKWSTSCSFGDLDGDGYLDLYVVHYLDFDLDNHKYCGELEPGYRVYCEPEVYNGVPDSLFWNERGRGGTWLRGELDREGASGNGLGLVVGDLTGDGRLEIYVANDRTPNTLWLHRGARRLENAGLIAGVAMSPDGVARAGMGVDLGDVDGDGAADIVVTNFSRESNAFFRTIAPGLFADDAAALGLTLPSLLPLGFGVNLFDLENDGDLDLFVANGHVTDNIDLYQPDLRHAQPDQIFLNEGGGRLAELTDERLGELAEPGVSRGSAVADLDGDGRLDLVVTECGGSARLFWNAHPAPGRTVRLSTVGRKAARRPLGANVWVESGGHRRLHFVRGGSSYLSQGPAWVHVGMGRHAETIEAVEIAWPGGRLERYPGPYTGERLVVLEGEGIISTSVAMRAPARRRQRGRAANRP